MLSCESIDLAGYVDGELDRAADNAVEAHLAECSFCREELNSQKQFLRLLENGLRRPEVDLSLPPNFTKRIVTTAENNVVGLRSWKERFNAVFIIGALVLFFLFIFESESLELMSSLSSAVGQLVAIGGFATQIAYSFLLGIVVLVRSLVHIVSPAGGASVFLGFIAVLGLITLLVKVVGQRKFSRPLF